VSPGGLPASYLGPPETGTGKTAAGAP
jgi:hypothetical protein